MTRTIITMRKMTIGANWGRGREAQRAHLGPAAWREPMLWWRGVCGLRGLPIPTLPSACWALQPSVPAGSWCLLRPSCRYGEEEGDGYDVAPQPKVQSLGAGDASVCTAVCAAGAAGMC